MVAADSLGVEPALLVGAGGAAGALARHAVAQRLDVEAFPVATFTVNVVGSFVLGLVAFGAAGEGVALFAGTGACGAFTTYSSVSVETVRLWETGERARATVYAGGTLLVASAAVALAATLVRGPV
jgi:CrcB protein